MKIKVVPVLDIMKGLVVHAIAGIREKYKPLTNSVLVNTSNPYALLEKLANMGFDEVYIADIDSILGIGENSNIIDKALSLGFKVLADVGVKGLLMKDSEKLTIVIGTEYLEKPGDLAKLRERYISLDTFYGEVKFGREHYSIHEVLNVMKNVEYKGIIILFLNAVGTLKGPDIGVAKIIAENCLSREVAVGGGIRGLGDLKNLCKIGVNKALVATSLHKGVITKPYYYF